MADKESKEQRAVDKPKAKKEEPKDKSKEVVAREPEKKEGFLHSTNQAIRKYYRETVGELKKVSWPTREEALRLTRIVIVVIVIMAIFLGLLDAIYSSFFGWLFTL